jgi:hypothetical protein
VSLNLKSFSAEYAQSNAAGIFDRSTFISGATGTSSAAGRHHCAYNAHIIPPQGG